MKPITTNPYWRLRKNTWVIKSWRRWLLRGSTIACHKKKSKHIIQTRAFVVMGEGVGFIRASNTTHLFMILSVKSLSRAQPVAENAKNANSEPVREARDTSFMWGRMSATRQRLFGPRTLEIRTETGPATSCSYSFVTELSSGKFLLLILRSFIKFAIMVQATNNIESVHGATGHGRCKKFSPSQERAKIGAKLCPRAAWIFSRPCPSVVEHAPTR